MLKQLAIAACGEHTQRVIEIGPGRGAFTKHLLPLVDELHAVEVDDRLANHVRQKLWGEAKLTVHHADVLETDLSQWGPAVVTGNLPYYITSPIIEKFLSLGPDFPMAVFLVQLEVANRLLAKGGTRDFGYLTVRTQLICDVELVCRVDPRAFNPPPQVESAAVRLTRRSDIPEDLDQIVKFAAHCFEHKRKTVRNNLRPYYGDEIAGYPEANLRAEQLGVAGVVEFYRRVRHASQKQ